MKKIIFKLAAITLCAASPLTYAMNACLENHQTKSGYFNDCNLNDNDINDLINLTNTDGIKNLNLANNHLTDKGIIQLVNQVKNLLDLDISNNKQVGNASLHAISYSNINELTLSKANINEDGLQHLVQNKNLTSLSISETLLNDAELKAIASSKYLGSIRLINDSITGDQAAIFANKKLNFLDLSHNPVGSRGIQSLANANISMLILNDCGADDEAAIALANSRSHSIRYLTLNHNKIGDKGAIALAQNSKIRILHLNYNNIGDEGAFAFANTQNQYLVVLAITNNSIGEAGLAALNKRAQVGDMFIFTENNDAKKYLNI